MPATEYDDASHHGLFFKAPNLNGATTYFVRQSELTLAALRAAGLLDNMIDGVVPPTIDKLWLDKNFDPAVLKEWNPVGANWQKVTWQTLFGRVPWRGTWAAPTIYRVGDLVGYGNDIWIAVQSSQNHIPAEDAYWDLFIPGAIIADGSITTPKLADGAVTPIKTTGIEPQRTISVTDLAYGASLSGGQTATQRRTAMQAAIDAAATLGYKLIIPKGTWIIDGALFFRNGSWIEGAGRRGTIVQLGTGAGAEEAVFRPEDYTGTVTSFRITDMTLDGNVSGRSITAVTSTARPGGSNFSLNGASGGNIERVRSINANLHCFDLCGPGEPNTYNSNIREYVAPINMDEDFTFLPGADTLQTNFARAGYTELAPLTINWNGYPSGGYYPALNGPLTRVVDCEAENAGDDPFTTHYARYIWIDRCNVVSGSNRHPSAAKGTSIGIEIDDGSRDIWVTNCYVKGCLRGIAVKCHDHNPSARNIRVSDCTIELCTIGLSAEDPYDPVGASPTAKDVIFSNITLRNLAQQFGDTDLVTGIECNAYQQVLFTNITIDGNYANSATYGAALSVGDSATDIIFSNITVQGWNPGVTDSARPLIAMTSSCKACSFTGIRFKNSGGIRGITVAGTHHFFDNIFLGGPTAGAVGSSYALLSADPVSSSFCYIGHISSENFAVTTRVNSVESVNGQMLTSKDFVSAGLNITGGRLNIGPRVTKTIASGVLTLDSTAVHYLVAGEGAANDDLVTINGTNDGDIIILSASLSNVDIVVKHGTGNIFITGLVDFTLTHTLDKIVLLNHNGSLVEVGRGNNQT